MICMRSQPKGAEIRDVRVRMSTGPYIILILWMFMQGKSGHINNPSKASLVKSTQPVFINAFSVF